MPRLVTTHADWREALTDLARNAEDELCIASPWVGFAAVRSLVQMTPGRVRLLVRWPQVASERHLVQGADLRALRDLAGLELRCLDERLHAKVYIRDASQALVGSGNLTCSATGLPDHSGAQNIEIGLLTKGDEVVELVEWFNGQWGLGDELSETHLRVLEDWFAIEVDQGAVPPPPPPPRVAPTKALATEAMRRLEAQGVVEPGWQPQSGFDKAAFKVRMAGAQADTVLRVHFSTARAEGESSFHFGFYASDISYARKKGLRASRVVMVPLDADRLHISDDAPLAVVPVNSVFWSKAARTPTQVLDPLFFAIKKIGGKRRHQCMTAYLERSDRGWILRVPTPSRRPRRRNAIIHLKRAWLVDAQP